MDEDDAKSSPGETKAQNDETAKAHHPVSNDISEFAELNQEERTETLKDKTSDKTTEPAGDTNQPNDEKSNDVDSTLLQSDEPKSKVIDCDGSLTCSSCMHVDRYRLIRSDGKIQM